MAIRLLKSPFKDNFINLFQKAKDEIIISSPFINEDGVDILLSSIDKPSEKSIKLLTNLSPRNIVDRVTQPSAILKMFDAFKATNLSDLKRLHAKTYIIDESVAVITSANLTKGGLITNFEYGVMIDDIAQIKVLKKDILDYASIGHIYNKDFILAINAESQKIKHISRDTTNEIELKKLLKSQNDISQILATQYNDKDTRHSIFAKTTEFLLQKHQQLTTEEIYNLIQELHPEMCDDNVKYSNGEKKWKIEVRQARFYLQRKNIVMPAPNLQHTWKLSK